MEEALDVILRLLDGQTVTQTTEWYDLHDARLQLRPFSDLEVAVTGSISPNGPKLAGKYGASLLSLAAVSPAGVALLADHWNVVETEAAVHGRTVSRDDWRLAGRMHIAETEEEAKREAEYGLEFFDEYLTTTQPGGKETFATPREYIDHVNETGRGVFGTPDMAIAYLQNLIDVSGGFGTFLLAHADYVRWPAQQRSLELIAEEVIPAMNGQLEPVIAAYESALSVGTEGAEITFRAQTEARERYNRQRAAG